MQRAPACCADQKAKGAKQQTPVQRVVALPTPGRIELAFRCEHCERKREARGAFISGQKVDDKLLSNSTITRVLDSYY